MTTLQQEWARYRDACYPKGCPGIQNRECHQAFFAGCLISFRLMDQLASLPEADAVKELHKLASEATEICQQRVTLNEWRQ